MADIYKKDELSVLFSSDDNYAQHMGVAMYSLLEHNKEFEKINIYIIDNEITENNKQKLESVVANFKNAELIFMPFAQYKNKLKLNMKWNISLSSYARLFVSSILPQDLNRILYLDCDMIICSSLNELWNTDLDDKIVAAVQDSVNKDTKHAVGIRSKNKYFNAGMLLLNLDNWRKNDTENKCLEFIDDHKGNVIHHDQGILNGLLHDKVRILPLRYNLMTIHFIYTRQQILDYFQEKSEFYSQEDIDAAKADPAILHFTPSFTSRPWVKGCKHPLKNHYWQTLEKTPWKGAKPQKDTTKLRVKVMDWKYRNFPSV